MTALLSDFEKGNELWNHLAYMRKSCFSNQEAILPDKDGQAVKSSIC